jgi:acyl-coenzyme A synthetase/AMP-(fatty) acid ligase
LNNLQNLHNLHHLLHLDSAEDKSGSSRGINAVDLFCRNAARHPEKIAICFELKKLTSYAALYKMAAQAQSFLKNKGFESGDGLLVFAKITPELYGVILGALAQGVTLIFVEPWMPVHLISRVLVSMKPKGFVCSSIGRVWGWRVPEIRAIEQRFTAEQIVSGLRPGAVELICNRLTPETKGIVTFTSGTTGLPKGVSRPHGYLVDAARIFHANVSMHESREGADLCIFANFALLNLAAGKTTILFPAITSVGDFSDLERQDEKLLPISVTCGPAFFGDLVSFTSETSRIRKSLEDIHVGGAPSDCALWEKGFEAFPKARFTHIYGSSEVEPVALIDAKVAVQRSRNRGFYQNLCVGETVPEISTRTVAEELWVCGPHVCPEYISASDSEHLVKQRDGNNNVWHNMGDRVQTLDETSALWYLGRSSRSLENVLLEQRIFSFLDSSDGFLIDTDRFGKCFVSSSAKAATLKFRSSFEQVKEVLVVAKIERDKRHRARIDIKRTIARNAPWLVG